MNDTSLMNEILLQEEKFQFEEFTNQTAILLGSRLANIAIENKYPLVIDITRSNQRLFYYANQGSSIDNEYWVERKKKTTLRFGRSSFLTKLKYQIIKPESFNDNGIVLDSTYALSGGCFPILVKNTGVIGTITVSGLNDLEDHNLIIKVITEYFNYNNSSEE